MLYALAHFLRDRLPWIWDLLDRLNALLFSARYGRKLHKVERQLLPDFGSGLKLIRLSEVPTEQMVSFFMRQPKEAFRFFRPHGFSANDIRKLQRNRAFLGYVVADASSNHIMGYGFNRSFFFGKGFRGRMVDIDFRGRGLGTSINRVLNKVGFGIGLQLFETVSKDNVASYRSALAASKVRVLEEKENNDLLLEILPDEKG